MSLLRVTQATVLRNHLIRSRMSAPARFAHGHYHHLPFKWPGEKKGRFALKVFAYMFTGFSIPFLAAEYQMKKAAGGS